MDAQGGLRSAHALVEEKRGVRLVDFRAIDADGFGCVHFKVNPLLLDCQDRDADTAVDENGFANTPRNDIHGYLLGTERNCFTPKGWLCRQPTKAQRTLTLPGIVSLLERYAERRK